MKNHDFMPTNLIFSNFRGARLPWIRPCQYRPVMFIKSHPPRLRMHNHNNTTVLRMEQEMLILPEYLSSPLVCSGIRIVQCFCVVFCRSVFVILSFFFWPFIVLSVLRFTAFDYPFGIFKLSVRKESR